MARRLSSHKYGQPIGKPSFPSRLRDFESLRCLSEDQKESIRPFISRHRRRYRTQLIVSLLIYFVSIVAIPLIVWLVTKNGIVTYFSLYVAIALAVFGLIRWQASTYADSILINQLLQALASLERNADKSWDLKARRQVMSIIESAADTAERSLSRALISSSPLTMNLIRQKTWQIAAALRELNASLALSSPAALQNMSEHLAASLIAAAKGHWDSLERVKYLKPEAPSGAARVARLIVAAGAGTLALLLLALSVYVQTDDGKDYLKTHGISTSITANLASIVSSLAAAVLLYRAGIKDKAVNTEKAVSAMTQREEDVRQDRPDP